MRIDMTQHDVRTLSLRLSKAMGRTLPAKTPVSTVLMVLSNLICGVIMQTGGNDREVGLLMDRVIALLGNAKETMIKERSGADTPAH
jgi:hypothetical protein